jgi:hypothetical protein
MNRTRCMCAAPVGYRTGYDLLFFIIGRDWLVTTHQPCKGRPVPSDLARQNRPPVPPARVPFHALGARPDQSTGVHVVRSCHSRCFRPFILYFVLYGERLLASCFWHQIQLVPIRERVQRINHMLLQALQYRGLTC